MRRPSFRAQLVAAFLGLVVAAEAITLVVLDRALADDLVAQLDARLVRQARGAAQWLAERRADREGGGPAYARHAERLALVVGAWVTVVDQVGEVQGDSEIDDEDERAEEAERMPEIADARRTGLGRAIRRSEHHQAEMYFVAARAPTGAVVRLAVPMATITATRAATRDRLWLAALLASLVALALGLFAARLIAGPVKVMTQMAERIAQGDYQVTLSDPSPDELGTLARTLTSLGAQLRARIGELVSERDRLSTILTGMSEGVLVSDAEERVVLANPSAVRLLGAEPAGRTIAALLGAPALAHPTREVAVGERTLVATAQRLPGGAHAGAVIVLVDVTERLRLEVMRRDFVAQISHELRTPVAAVQGYAETLMDGAVDEATRAEFVQVIHRQARRMGRLVADLLRLAELEARPPEQVRDVPIALAEVARHVVETMRDRAEAAEVTVIVEVPPALEARGDPDDLEQVLENLVDNAIRYGARPGAVRIGGAARGERVELWVEDDGEGIPAEHLPRLFERFYRVDPARSRKLGGTGLGLAIVQRLVAGLRGEVRVESAPGAGARFVVSLAAPKVAA